MQGLRIDSEQRGDSLLLRLAGRASALDHEVLDDRASTIIESKPRSVVVDLSSLDFLGSFGLSVLIRLDKSIRRNGGAFSIAAPSEEAMDIIRKTRLDQTLTIHDSVEAALH
ncbi:MAG: STAS domain-containing protein [Planctomycetota bacterium]